MKKQKKNKQMKNKVHDVTANKWKYTKKSHKTRMKVVDGCKMRGYLSFTIGQDIEKRRNPDIIKFISFFWNEAF